MVIREELRRHCYLMFVSMRALFIFVVFQCIHEAWFQSCISTGTDYICKKIPKGYPAGLTSVIIFVGGLGEISLSMFNSTNLASVNSLTIADQGVTAIGPQTFEEFQNLRTLNLDNNHLSQVSSAWFSHQVTLEILRLSNNKITTLDHNSFDGMSNLLNLNLSQNQIHTISPSSFLGLSKLRELDLSNNNLTHLNTDAFLPLNGTKIRLDENPWDCSCSVNNFAKYLRGLRNASLLENELQVCCNSPPHLKGLPVWQVPECETFTTMSLTTGSPGTENPATVLITKPLTIGHSTLIILIVVLCALVLVICVLSVLYHRKRERKHLHAVKPASEKSERIRNSESTAKSNREENRKKEKSEIATKTQIATTEVLLRTNQMVAGDEKISQIYHIYSSGPYETREAIKRVRSAGPVLCRMEMFSKPTEADTAADEVRVRSDEYYNGWMTSENQKDNVYVNIEEVEKLENGENIEEEENDGFTDEVSNILDALESHEELEKNNEDTDERLQAGTSADKDVLQHSVENDVLDPLPGAGGSQDALQVKQYRSQSEETAENLPYLSIGADPENQTSGVDQNTAKRTSGGPLRPIRRVLTWPPTAVQWKKQWAQNQQVLNVFPQLIFVTGCRHEIGSFNPGISPAIFPTAPQFNALEFLPEITSPMEDVRVAIDEDTYRASLETSNQRVLHFNAKECFANTNISPREDGRIFTNEETWRSGLESTIFSDLSSKNSPIDESEVCSELFSSFSFNPPFGGSKSKPAFGEEINKNLNVEQIQSVKTKTHRVHQSEQVASELHKQSRRAGKAAGKAARRAAQRAHRDRQQGQGQMFDGSDSRAPPAGGSPKDDSLLRGNEYTFIDLLHEVVENHGRWTRDRWRQTQKNKHKLKQSR